MAHRDRRDRRRPDLPAGKPDQSGLTLFQIQPQDTAGSWNNTLGVVNLQYGPAISYPLILAFFFSLLQANWTYTGYDASAHVAEETVGARMASAWGVFLSVAVSAIVGYIFLVALTTHLPNLSTLFPATLETPIQAGASQYYFGGGVAVIDILELQPRPDRRHPRGRHRHRDGVLWPVVDRRRPAGCCSRSAATTGSRRRAGSRRCQHRYRTPANSLIAIVVVAWLFTVARRSSSATGTAIVIVTAISTIFLYAAYGVVHLPRRDDEGLARERVWSLGRWSKPIAWVAVFWVIVLMVAVLVPDLGQHLVPVHGRDRRPACSIYYFGWAGRSFKGPQRHGRRGRADRDRARVRARRRASSGAPAPLDRIPRHRSEGRPARRPALAIRSPHDPETDR